jgi:GNAT superfamily N-acetyltransferase
MPSIRIRPLGPEDLEVVPRAFAAVNWPGKPAAMYRDYLRQQESGLRQVLVATLEHTFAGYVTVCPTSGYPPFREDGIPEIQDLNVLPGARRRGVGSALMDAAEADIVTRSPVAGIGVGLYAAYGAAQRLYARRGYVPDGRGVVCRDVPVAPGATVVVDDDLVLMMTRRLPGGSWSAEC